MYDKLAKIDYKIILHDFKRFASSQNIQLEYIDTGKVCDDNYIDD